MPTSPNSKTISANSLTVGGLTAPLLTSLRKPHNMQIVVVAHNKFKPLTHAFWPLRLLRGCNPNAVVSGFFIAPVTTSVPHTLISAPDCGSVGVKRFTLTQGGRVHEGSAPSDKRPCRLIVNRGNYGIVGSINKAAEPYKGVCPIQYSPQAESRTLTNHHPYRSPCMLERKVAP